MHDPGTTDFTRFCRVFNAGLRAGENSVESRILPAQARFAAEVLAIDQTEAACIAHPRGTMRVVRAHLGFLKGR